jgi:hypothetical protein
MDNQTTESDWSEWKEKCAFELCSEHTQERFEKFCSIRLFGSNMGGSSALFSKVANRLRITGDIESKKKTSIIFSLIDSQFMIDQSESRKKGKNNKNLKDWLIEGSPNLEHIEAKATFFIYDAKKKIIKQELGTEIIHIPPTKPVNKEGLTIEDIAKPDTDSPSEKLKAKDLKEELYEKANFYFDGLTADRKVAIIAKHLNISLQHPIVIDLAGKKHSVLYENLNKDLTAFAKIIQRCELMENESDSRLKQASCHILGQTSLEWAKKTEKGSIKLLTLSND